jgi:hypothetical protein
MPPLVIAGGIAAAAQLGSSALQSRSANKAAKAQGDASAQALAFSKEQEAAAQGRYGTSKAQYDKQVADWYAARNALLGRYGVDINLGGGGLPSGGSGAPVGPPGAVPRATQPAMPAQGATLGEIMQSKNPQEETDWWSAAGLGPRRA